MPFIYEAGVSDVFTVTPDKSETMRQWLGAILEMNKVTDNYTFDSAQDEVWGIASQKVYFDGTGRPRQNCHVRAQGYTSEDSEIYTMFVDSNPALADSMAWTEWEFFSRFSREPDGTLKINE